MYPYCARSNSDLAEPFPAPITRRQRLRSAPGAGRGLVVRRSWAVRVGETGEGTQVGQALAALGAPRPFPPDGGGEAELQGRVEVVVGVAEQAAEQPVDVGRAERPPPGQVHVPRRVEGEVDPVHAPVALEQETVEGLVVLIGLAAEERLHAEAVLADHEPGHGG